MECETSRVDTTSRGVPKHYSIETHADGTMYNIPPTMLTDQYGMAGLLSTLRSSNDNRPLVSLAIGQDLTKLGLEIGSLDNKLAPSFGGPWASVSVRTQDIDVVVPDEYLTNLAVRDRLPPIKLTLYNDDLLFFLFYNCPSELYQVAAASELYSRHWRFHRRDMIWLTKLANSPTQKHGDTAESGQFVIFDVEQWRKVQRDLYVEYTELEPKPRMSHTQMLPMPGTGGAANGNGGLVGGDPTVP